MTGFSETLGISVVIDCFMNATIISLDRVLSIEQGLKPVSVIRKILHTSSQGEVSDLFSSVDQLIRYKQIRQSTPSPQECKSTKSPQTKKSNVQELYL